MGPRAAIQVIEIIRALLLTTSSKPMGILMEKIPFNTGFCRGQKLLRESSRSCRLR